MIHKGWIPVCSFCWYGSPVKTQAQNGLNKLFDFWGHTIAVSDQSVFTLEDLGLHDEKGKKTNVSDPLAADQRRSGRFVVFHDDGPYRPGWYKLQEPSYEL